MSSNASTIASDEELPQLFSTQSDFGLPASDSSASGDATAQDAVSAESTFASEQHIPPVPATPPTTAYTASHPSSIHGVGLNSITRLPFFELSPSIRSAIAPPIPPQAGERVTVTNLPNEVVDLIFRYLSSRPRAKEPLWDTYAHTRNAMAFALTNTRFLSLFQARMISIRTKPERFREDLLYTPPQNGLVIEARNPQDVKHLNTSLRLAGAALRELVITKNLPDHSWVEGAEAAVAGSHAVLDYGHGGGAAAGAGGAVLLGHHGAALLPPGPDAGNGVRAAVCAIRAAAGEAGVRAEPAAAAGPGGDRGGLHSGEAAHLARVVAVLALVQRGPVARREPVGNRAAVRAAARAAAGQRVDADGTGAGEHPGGDGAAAGVAVAVVLRAGGGADGGELRAAGAGGGGAAAAGAVHRGAADRRGGVRAGDGGVRRDAGVGVGDVRLPDGGGARGGGGGHGGGGGAGDARVHAAAEPGGGGPHVARRARRVAGDARGGVPATRSRGARERVWRALCVGARQRGTRRPRPARPPAAPPAARPAAPPLRTPPLLPRTPPRTLPRATATFPPPPPSSFPRRLLPPARRRHRHRRTPPIRRRPPPIRRRLPPHPPPPPPPRANCPNSHPPSRARARHVHHRQPSLRQELRFFRLARHQQHVLRLLQEAPRHTAAATAPAAAAAPRRSSARIAARRARVAAARRARRRRCARARVAARAAAPRAEEQKALLQV
ncbi:hypothetical protein FGB62_187g03 [Gracilaria domingensis]|nr:hypothetical protein FGB62_187g03 [Gracilaria domingensis]